MAVDFESFGFTRHFFPGNPLIFLRVTRAETRASRSSKWVKDNRELLAKISPRKKKIRSSDWLKKKGCG